MYFLARRDGSALSIHIAPDLNLCRSVESATPPSRIILHLDMDAFYASVEQRDQPSLRGQPVIVGSPPTQRGVVAAASYEARKFGVKSAMPSVTAGRLCPRGIFVRPRMEVYREESRQIMSLVKSLAGEQIQQVSVDEAYLDVTNHIAGDPSTSRLELALELARSLKDHIWTQRHLTASIGVASNKMLAKLASDFQKPNGLTLIRDSEKVAFLRPLPVRTIHGVGTVTEQQLHQRGLITIGDLQDFKGDLRAVVGSWAEELHDFAFGIDERPLDLSDDTKSMSSENTFLKDTEDRPTLRRCLHEQAVEIRDKLVGQRLAAHTIQVKVRYGDFTTVTRQFSLEDPIDDARTLYRTACWLLGREKLVHRPLRLLGLGVSHLVDSQSRQLKLPLDAVPFPRT